MARPHGWLPPGAIYHEEVSGRFYRVPKLGNVDILVASADDRSAIQMRRYFDCWACAKRVLHSEEQHYVILTDAGERYTTHGVDDRGVAWRHIHSEPISEQDE
ncbi:MAG TPA: hypothetical protein VNM48_19185 [Chloroflexota bacterium]|nr:hypothetical protein [Chloroflexota bacterium]